MDIRRLFHGIWRRRWLLAGAALLGLAAGHFVASRQLPLYEARSQLMLETRRPAGEALPSMVGEIELSNAALQSEMQVLRSNLLLERVVLALGLQDWPEFKPAAFTGPGALDVARDWIAARLGMERAASVPEPDVSPGLEQVTRALQSRVQVLREGGSYSINVFSKSMNPELAAALSNEIVRQYIEWQVEQRQVTSSRIADWLDERMQTVRRRVDEAEEKVEALRAENLSFEGTGPEAVARQLSSWSDILAQSRADLAAHEARLQEYYNMSSSGTTDATSMVEGNATVATLRQRVADLSAMKAELGVTYGEDNERIGRVETREAAVKQELAQAVERHLVSMRDEAALRAESAAANVRNLEQRAQDLSSSSLRLRQLEREASSLRQVYSSLLTQLNQNDAQQPMPQADARIVSRADVPQVPSEPRVTLIAALGGVLGLGVGLGGVLLAEATRRTYRSREDVEADLRLPLLTTIPKGRWKRRGLVVDWMKRREGLEFAESIRALRTALIFSSTREAKVIMIASAEAGEGKTTVALALASLFASMDRRVLLLDGDLRRPSLATTTGRKALWGLVSVLAGEAQTSDAILHDPEFGFDMLVNDAPAPAASGQLGPVDALSTPAFRGLVEGFRRDYDIVIIDTAPLLHASDAIVIGRLADATIFVVREGGSLVGVVKQAVTRLLEMRVAVAGVALNMSRSAASSTYGSPITTPVAAASRPLIEGED